MWLIAHRLRTGGEDHRESGRQGRCVGCRPENGTDAVQDVEAVEKASVEGDVQGWKKWSFSAINSPRSKLLSPGTIYCIEN